MLDKEIGKVVDAALPFVTDAIWLGRAGSLRGKTALNCPGDANVKAGVERLLGEQTNEWLVELYRRYRDNGKIKFKDSIKKAVGLDRPTKAGMDV